MKLLAASYWSLALDCAAIGLWLLALSHWLSLSLLAPKTILMQSEGSEKQLLDPDLFFCFSPCLRASVVSGSLEPANDLLHQRIGIALVLSNFGSEARDLFFWQAFV